MIRCWQCGMEPTDVSEVRTFNTPEPRYIPTGWPESDHEHTVEPPTPAELAAAGDRARARILEDW